MIFRNKKSDISFDEAIAQTVSESDLVESPISSYIFWGSLLGVGFFAAIAVFRIAELGIINGSAYAAKAEANINKELQLAAPRGVITDRFGEPLVSNISIFSLYLKVGEMIKSGERVKVESALKEILDLSLEDFLKELPGNLEKADDIKIAEDISREQSIKLDSLGLSSISVRSDYKRKYSGPAFSHVLGYVGPPRKEDLAKDRTLSLIDTVGRTGIEAYYDKELRGRNGKETVYKNAKGEFQEIEGIEEPKPGENLETTIDAPLQQYFYDSLIKNTTLRGQTSAVGIALNPKTGEILSLISLPGYDPNNLKKYLNTPTQPLFNRAISGTYNPGSTIKPLHAIAGLHEGVIGKTLEIFSRGYIEIPNIYNPDAPSRFVDLKPNGWVDVYSAIAKSSNIFFYAMSGGLPPNEAEIIRGASKITGLGIERINGYWRIFGLDRKTGIDLPGEADSFLPNPEEKQKRTGQIWRVGDTYNISIGQGDISVNMLQLADYFAAIANKGKVYKPHIAKNEEGAENNVLLDLSEFSNEFYAVEKGMQDSVYKSYGTSTRLAEVPFKIAAKTGTAQTNFNTKANALVVAYGPTDAPGGPEIEVLVLIENAKEGSLNAIPIAKDVLTWYYENRLNKK